MQGHLELMRDQARAFPELESPGTLISARIWHCKFVSLAPLARLVGLRRLEVASYPDSTFDYLAALKRLEELRIVHLPHIRSLAPLSQLASLRTLSLATLPSWDSSRKVTVVESLEPLARMPSLERLELFGVVPESRDARELFSSASLKVVSVSQFPKSQEQLVRERFAA